MEPEQTTTATIAADLGDSVVGVGRGVRGAGVVVGDGLVLTNAHNLRGEEMTVTCAGVSTAVATVAGVDLDGDLAVLRVDTRGARAPEWGEAPGLGAEVWALARTPDAALRVTSGHVSSTGRRFRGPRGRVVDGFEHTSPLARGSSGGPVLDAAGRLVGLNTHRVGDGFYLAIAAGADLRRRVDSLAAGSSPSRRSLGIAVAPPHVARNLRRSVGLSERDGLLVRDVDPDGPAARGGIEEGDLIVRAGERDLSSVDDLHAALDAAGPGDDLDLGVVRGESERDVRVTFTADEGT
ncbi:MAG: S1C family serine protease [Acidimicrobiia bacterium]|nr:S1C family serine protease [Acidimicrobiia bacterium]